MEKILCIVGGMNMGGAETFLMKIYRSIPRNKYQMDFCVTNPNKGFYDDEIIKMGGKIIHISPKSKNPLKSFLDIKKVVKGGKYKNVLRISQHSLSSLDLLAAKFGGAKNLIFRSSNSNSCGSKFNSCLHNLLKPLAIKIPNKKIAPSDVAAIHMFGNKNYMENKVTILNNGLPLEKFKFNEETRKEIRKKLNIEEKFVIGHVGRFTKQKNHKFLIDIFQKYLLINPKAILLLLGDGELKDDIIKDIKSKEIEDKIIILGNKLNANDYYQAMDCFVFPSLYEGMPNTIIEAQTSGLNCVISDTITEDVKINENVIFCSLNDIENWVNNINESSIEYRKRSYINVKENGYDIKDVVKAFIRICYERD